MKLRMKVMAMILIVATAASLLAACGGGSGTTDNKDGNSDSKIKIGIALPTAQEEIWIKHSESLKKYCEEKGYECSIQVANNDTDKQYSQIENMLTSGIDVLILSASDPGATTKLVKQAHEEGVIVIGYDRVFVGDLYDAYLTFDNVAVGREMAKYAVASAPTGDYALLGGDITTQPVVDDIHKGWMEVLQEYIDKGDINIVADQNCKNWASDEGLAQCENALTANNNEMTAVLCANDGIAGGAIEALATAGLAGKTIVTGQDCEVAAVQRVAKGTQKMTLYKAPDDLAKATLDVVEKLLNGEDLDITADYEGIPMITVNPQPIDTDNIQSILIDSGVMIKKDIYGK